MKILLSGLPGGGKTTLGEFLAAEYGFFHADMEADDWALAQEAHADPAGFLQAFGDAAVVLTWGFQPEASLDVVRALVDGGCTPVWLDGDRVHFFTWYMHREQARPDKEFCYYLQLLRIIRTRTLAAVAWHVVDPFQPNGAFRPSGEIAAEILKVATT